MSEIMKIIEEFKNVCPCGKCHETSVKDVRIGSGIVSETGTILKENGFPKTLLLVADKNTYSVAGAEIVELLKAACIPFSIYVYNNKIHCPMIVFAFISLHLSSILKLLSLI